MSVPNIPAMNKSSSVATQKPSSSPSAWADGLPPLQQPAASPSRSPSSTTTATPTHSRKSSILSRAVPVRDGVSVPKDIAPSSSHRHYFGTIDANGSAGPSVAASTGTAASAASLLVNGSAGTPPPTKDATATHPQPKAFGSIPAQAPSTTASSTAALSPTPSNASPAATSAAAPPKRKLDANKFFQAPPSSAPPAQPTASAPAIPTTTTITASPLSSTVPPFQSNAPNSSVMAANVAVNSPSQRFPALPPPADHGAPYDQHSPQIANQQPVGVGGPSQSHLRPRQPATGGPRSPSFSSRPPIGGTGAPPPPNVTINGASQERGPQSVADLPTGAPTSTTPQVGSPSLGQEPPAMQQQQQQPLGGPAPASGQMPDQAPFPPQQMQMGWQQPPYGGWYLYMNTKWYPHMQHRDQPPYIQPPSTPHQPFAPALPPAQQPPTPANSTSPCNGPVSALPPQAPGAAVPPQINANLPPSVPSTPAPGQTPITTSLTPSAQEFVTSKLGPSSPMIPSPGFPLPKKSNAIKITNPNTGEQVVLRPPDESHSKHVSRSRNIVVGQVHESSPFRKAPIRMETHEQKRAREKRAREEAKKKKEIEDKLKKEEEEREAKRKAEEAERLKKEEEERLKREAEEELKREAEEKERQEEEEAKRKEEEEERPSLPRKKHKKKERLKREAEERALREEQEPKDKEERERALREEQERKHKEERERKEREEAEAAEAEAKKRSAEGRKSKSEEAKKRARELRERKWKEEVEELKKEEAETKKKEKAEENLTKEPRKFKRGAKKKIEEAIRLAVEAKVKEEAEAKEREEKEGEKLQAPSLSRTASASSVPMDRSSNQGGVGASGIGVARSKLAVDENSPEFIGRKVKGLLNKLALGNFDSISDQIIWWVNKSSENEKSGATMILVIELVYQKATDEDHWSETYARLCRKMMEQISQNVQDDNIRNNAGEPIVGGHLFRRYLLDRCQEDFKRGWSQKKFAQAAAALKAAGHTVVEDASKVDNNGEPVLYSDESDALLKARRQGQGLIRFLGELFKLQMLSGRIMHDCIKKLLLKIVNPGDEETESLCKLLTTVGQALDTRKAKKHMDIYFWRIQMLAGDPNVEWRIWHMLLDVIELRLRRWRPRNATAGPSTITQVHEQNAKEKAAAAQRASKVVPMTRGGPRHGGRGAPEQGPDGWNVAGPTPVRAPAKAGDPPPPSTRGSLSPATSGSKVNPLLGAGGADAETMLKKTPSGRGTTRKPSVDQAPQASPDMPLRRKLQLLPRTIPLANTNEDSAGGEDKPENDERQARPTKSFTKQEAKAKVNEDVKEFFNIRDVREGDNGFAEMHDEHKSKLVDKLASKALDYPWTPAARTKLVVDKNSPGFVERKVKRLLNKLTLVNFHSVASQIIKWVNKSETEKNSATLILVIKLVFEKATDEAHWSEMYARLCRTMMEQISQNVQDDNTRNNAGEPLVGGHLLHKCLINRCGEDFERGWSQREFTQAAAALKTADDKAARGASQANYEDGDPVLYSDEYCALLKAKRQVLSLVRFMGDLFKLQMLSERIMHNCIKTLLSNIDNLEEEEIKSFCKLLTAVGQALDTRKARGRMNIYFGTMQMLADNPNVESRIRYMLLDVIELRQRSWGPRNATADPSTITQVWFATENPTAVPSEEEPCGM